MTITRILKWAVVLYLLSVPVYLVLTPRPRVYHAAGGSGPTVAPKAAPELEAEVRFTNSGATFIVTNRGRTEWRDVEARINSSAFAGGYVATVPRIGAGARIAIPGRTFADAAGARFNFIQTKPQKFWMAATVDGTRGFYAASFK